MTVVSLPLDGLNPQQHEAVVHDDGPLLVVAGAGSGKTRVLTHRIARLIADGVHPYEILAITFTNKAAGEMKDRVGRLVGDDLVGIRRDEAGQPMRTRWGGMWVQTFHSACARLLRAEAPRLGYQKHFSIYDTGDSGRVIRDVIRDLGLDTKKIPIRAAHHEISRAKNELLDFESYAEAASGWWESQVADIYKAYAAKLHAASAMDFDDLLVKTVEIFMLFPDVLERYQRQFAHVLVDEWQDTNRAQYEMVRMLAAEHRNVCVVGDSDQSIYAFRGADIRNLLDFESDFPDATRIVLDRNYRSTQTILDAANAVISHNTQRMAKDLWTDLGAGEQVVRYTAENEHDEAAFVIEEIRRLESEHGISPGDCAIFYRTNAQSRVLEEVLLRLEMNYQVIGSTRFYDRKEVKDALAYLTVLVNPDDDVAVGRILNVPRRGIGDKSAGALAQFAARERVSLLEAARQVGRITSLTSRSQGSIEGFVGLMDRLRTAWIEEELSPREVLARVLDDSGYRAELEADRSPESEGRLENLAELEGVAEDYAALVGEDTPGVGLLAEFLERVQLTNEQDALSDTGAPVTLMTLHNAKGLEYPVVFLVGMEEGIFPHSRTLSEPAEIEEERRLCYVGMTRAERRLYLASAWSRTLFGGTQSNPPSRFLGEVPPEMIDDRSADRGGPSRRALATAGVRTQYRRRSEPDEDEDFKAGDRVLHTRFGEGRILEMTGSPGEEEAVIDFDDLGPKRLVLAYAPLIRA
ncbi:DNA helicase PcrA [Euzebya tangerina]|uniref:DNA helicase PcrA n=1 Tax=Euzebya tangerina TaxID=591198 RepID=UPI000E3191E7|nr:DNA helicase PcrA [Euzebya tangerina]